MPLLISLTDAGAGAADALKYRSEEDIMRGKEEADREVTYAGMTVQQKKKAKEKVTATHMHTHTHIPVCLRHLDTSAIYTNPPTVTLFILFILFIHDT